MKFRLKIVLVNLLLVLSGLVVLEIAFGTWFSNVPSLYNFTKPRNVRMTFHADMPGQPPEIVYTRDRYGFRGLDGSLEDIFILTVGGSTTDQRFVADGLTFQDLLQARFLQEGRVVDIVNAGVDGQSTFGHIVNFHHWFEKLPQLKPKFILFYVGINDFYNFSRRDGYDQLDRQRGSSLIASMKDRSAIYAVIRIVRSAMKPPQVGHLFDVSEKFADSSTYTTTRGVAAYRTEAVETSLSQLGERLVELVERTRLIGAVPILVTQRSRLWHRKNGQIIGVPQWQPDRFSPALTEFADMTGVDRYYLERLQAEKILEICRKTQETCIDLADEIELDPSTDFYDDFHTTPAGSAKIAEFLYEKLKTLPSIGKGSP